MRSFFVFCVFCSLMFLLGCGRPPEHIIKTNRVSHYVLHVDRAFKAEDRKIILASFVEWQSKTNGIVTFEVSEKSWVHGKDDLIYNSSPTGCTNDVYVASVGENDEYIRQLDKKTGVGNTLAYTSSTCDSKFVGLMLQRITGSADLRSTALHEAGHLIGLDHIPVPDSSIMYPARTKTASCITQLDMKQFCEMYGCNWRDMTYCAIED